MPTKIEGRDIKTKRRMKGWAGWAPVSQAEKAKFQELVLCPRSGFGKRDPREIEEGDGLVLLHDSLAGRCGRDQSYHNIVKESEQVLCA